MKSVALIFVIFAGALKAEIPTGATDLVPRSDSPAVESLKMKDEPVTTTSYSEITITSLDSQSSIEVPSDLAERKEEIKKWMATSPKQRHGHVFKPTGHYPEDKEIDVRLSAPAFVDAASLADLTRKEVFVSARVQFLLVPEIKIKAYPSIVADEIIKKLKEANITVVEVGPYTLALVDIPINYPEPSIIRK